MTSHTPGNDQYFYDEFVAFALAPFISQGLKLKGEGIVLQTVFSTRIQISDLEPVNLIPTIELFMLKSMNIGLITSRSFQ